MIDTDKYEGHTLNHPIHMDEPNPHDGGHREMLCDGGIIGWLLMDNYPSADANAMLLADAPLLLAEVKRLRKLEAAVVGSWMESCDRGSPWHKQLRYPCVDLGYLELRDVEHISRIGNRYTSKHFCLKEEYEEMAKQWIKEEYGVEEE